MIVRDSQSNPSRAADVASELILDDEVEMVLVASTPETTNPVATTCEAEGIPCVSTVAPWQPWFVGQQGTTDPERFRPFDYAYHFFWGLEDVIAVFTAMWGQIETNRVVGALFPNDGDGNAWGDPVLGFPPALEAQGYTLVDPGRYQNLTDDFSAQIAAFRGAGAEIVTGVPIPPDFTTFWSQAKQQGFAPKAASVGKALLFPQAVGALGDQGHNLSTEVWWSPSHPFASSLTGQSCEALAAAYTQATGQPWTQPIGFVHALFEVAAGRDGRGGRHVGRRCRGRGDLGARARQRRRPAGLGRRGPAGVRRGERGQDAARGRPVAAARGRRLRPGDRRQRGGAADPHGRRDGAAGVRTGAPRHVPRRGRARTAGSGGAGPRLGGRGAGALEVVGRAAGAGRRTAP